MPAPAPVIRLPRQFEGVTLSQLVAGLQANFAQGALTELVFDFSTLCFIRPAGVVFLSNVVHWLAQLGCKVTFQGVAANNSAVIRFLDDSLFFEQHCGRKLRADAAPRDTTRPLVKVAQSASHAWLDRNLVPWLSSRLSITQSSLYSFRAVISELFNNIKDHTTLDIGSIFVQHFPNKKRVVIAVSDFGAGIPSTVRNSLPSATDSEAIIQAVQEGFTTRSIPTNQGVGLDLLLKTAVAENRGTVTIYSLGGIVMFSKAGTRIRPYVFPQVGFCPGTTIEISLRTDTIQVLPDESEEMAW